MQTNIQKISVQEKFLHEKFVTFGKNAKEWIWKCSLLLPEIEKYEIWKKKGFTCIYEYAAKLAGMSRLAVDDALWVLKKIEDKPALLKVVEEKGINAVRPVVTIATRETMDFWAEKAREMSRHTLETYVQEIKKNLSLNVDPENFGLINSDSNQVGLFEAKYEYSRRTGPDFDVKTENGGTVMSLLDEPKSEDISWDVPKIPNMPETFQSVKKLVAMQLDPQILAQLEKLKGENGDWNDLMKQLLQMREEHLEEQKPEPVKTDSRHIPAKIDRYVTSRTNGQCAFPGCNKKLNIKHHTQRFALENVHDSDRLYGLCKAHERIAHLGLIENEDLSPKLWKVRKSADISSEIGKAKYAIDQVVQRFRTSPA